MAVVIDAKFMTDQFRNLLSPIPYNVPQKYVNAFRIGQLAAYRQCSLEDNPYKRCGQKIFWQQGFLRQTDFQICGR